MPMPSAIQERRNLSSRLLPDRAWKTGSVVAGCVAVALAAATFAFHQIEFGGVLLIVALVTFCVLAALHARFLYLGREQFRNTSGDLETRDLEYHAIFENALDAILILDGRAICRVANPSALRLLGVRREQLIDQPIGAYYPDQARFDASWKRLLTQEHDRGQSEIMCSDGTRVFIEFTATANFLPGRHMMVLRDITQRLRAEGEKERSLALAKSAWQEADALRQATLALTQDLRMNSVLDTLLQTLHQLVPYESAQVLLLETGSKLFLAREAFPGDHAGKLAECPRTLDAQEHPTLVKALRDHEGILISDTLNEDSWQAICAGSAVRSWLGVPLCAANQVVGLLSVAHTVPGRFTAEHLRITG